MIQKANSPPLWKLKQLMTLIANSAPYVFTSWQANSGSFEEVALGIRVILYLDNILILSTTREGAKKGLAVVLEFFVALGFVVNTKKSVMDPTQSLEFLGFVIDSQWMIISLPTEKFKPIRKLAEEIHQQAHYSVRKMAQLREWWWQLTQQSWQLPFITDVWRGWERRTYDRAKLQGTTSSESECPEGVDLMDKWGSSVKRQILVHYTMGPHNRNRCIHQGVGCLFPEDDHGGAWTAAERQQWHLGMVLGEWSHNPCRALTWHTNVRADRESCHIIDSSDWMLGRDVFLQLEQIWGTFSINLFTTRTNAQLSAYCSWHPDPSAQTVDALSISWRDHFAYMFPPFSLIMWCLKKSV